MVLRFLIAVVAGAGGAWAHARQSSEITTEQVSVLLLGNGAVQKELGLTSTQIAGVKAEAKRYLDAVRAQKARQASDPDSRRESAQALERERIVFTARMLNSLSDAQKKRLRELGLQYFGAFAILAPDVAAEIGITTAQREKILQSQRRFQDWVQALRKRRESELKSIPQPKNPEDAKAQAQYLRQLEARVASFRKVDVVAIEKQKARAEAEVLAVLNARQRSQWTRMLGRKFEFPPELKGKA